MTWDVLLNQLSSFLSSDNGVISWVTDISNLITTVPFVFLMVVCLPVAGYGLGWLKRLIRI